MAPMFIPGPVDVAEEVLQAQTKAIIPHRSAEFQELFQWAESQLRKMFFTEGRVFITASSGSGLQEAAVRNFVSGRMLACVNGAFGSRWHAVAQSNGKDVDKLEVDWQQPVSPEIVAEAVAGKTYDIVAVVHNETSTGIMNPIKEIAQVVHESNPDTLVCVDAVSSFSGVNLEMDNWGLDMVLTSSQKCLALPPGLGFAAVNERAMARAKTVENRGWYFDFVRLEKHREKDSTPATPAISLIYALEAQLKRMLAEGLENRFARHSAMAERVQSWSFENGLEMYAPEGYRSQTVTTIENTLGIDVSALNEFLLARDMRIAGGYGHIKSHTFRIGHMGELRLEDVNVLLAALEEYLAA